MMVKKILLMTMTASRGNMDRDVQRFSAGTEMVATAVIMTEGSMAGPISHPPAVTLFPIAALALFETHQSGDSHDKAQKILIHPGIDHGHDPRAAGRRLGRRGTL
jgi:hypothetical protein